MVKDLKWMLPWRGAWETETGTRCWGSPLPWDLTLSQLILYGLFFPFPFLSSLTLSYYPHPKVKVVLKGWKVNSLGEPWTRIPLFSCLSHTQGDHEGLTFSPSYSMAYNEDIAPLLVALKLASLSAIPTDLNSPDSPLWPLFETLPLPQYLLASFQGKLSKQVVTQHPENIPLPPSTISSPPLKLSSSCTPSFLFTTLQPYCPALDTLPLPHVPVLLLPPPPLQAFWILFCPAKRDLFRDSLYSPSLWPRSF